MIMPAIMFKFTQFVPNNGASQFYTETMVWVERNLKQKLIGAIRSWYSTLKETNTTSGSMGA